MEKELIHSGDGDWLFVTDRANLITILSSGVVELAGNELRHRPDLRDECNGRVVFFQDTIPADAIDFLKDAGCRIPAVLRFSSSIVDRLSENTHTDKGQVSAISDIPVSLTALISIEFLSQGDYKDSLERLDMLNSQSDGYVSQSLFSATNSDVSIKDCIHTDEEQFDSETPLLDDVVGAIASVLKVEATDESELQMLGGIARDLECISDGDKPIASWLEADLESDESELKSRFDSWLWPALLEQLLAVDSKDGFGSIAFLDQFINEKTDLQDDLRKIAYTWRDVVKQVLDNEKDIPNLADKGRPVQRGALLFLLRRTPDRLIEKGVEEIDSTVRAVAVAFAGCLSGFMGLDDRLRPERRVCMSIVDSLIDSKSGSKTDDLIKHKLELSDKNNSKFSLIVGSENLKSFESEFKILDDHIFQVVEQAGYELEIDCTGWKQKFVSKAESKAFRVSRIKQNNSQFRPIRIEGVCRDISAKTALKTLGIEVLARLLSTGGATDGRCRYSICANKNAIVAIKDQLLDTMDKEEFLRHFHSVVHATVEYKDFVKKPSRAKKVTKNMKLI